jgi:peptide deformylase
MLEIVRWPDPILEKKADPVTEFDDKLKEFAAEMTSVMHVSKGIGLAAPQVGVSKRILEIAPMDGKFHRTMINPEIVSTVGQVIAREGCLSFPGIEVKVKRAQALKVRYQILDGSATEEVLTGARAIVFQHEYDHLEGITFLQHVSEVTRKLIQKRMERINEKT